jgi:hypothetical protein
MKKLKALEDLRQNLIGLIKLYDILGQEDLVDELLDRMLLLEKEIEEESKKQQSDED